MHGVDRRRAVAHPHGSADVVRHPPAQSVQLAVVRDRPDADHRHLPAGRAGGRPRPRQPVARAGATKRGDRAHADGGQLRDPPRGPPAGARRGGATPRSDVAAAVRSIGRIRIASRLVAASRRLEAASWIPPRFRRSPRRSSGASSRNCPTGTFEIDGDDAAAHPESMDAGREPRPRGPGPHRSCWDSRDFPSRGRSTEPSGATTVQFTDLRFAMGPSNPQLQARRAGTVHGHRAHRPRRRNRRRTPRAMSPRLGAHMSVAGGLPRAVERAVVHRCEALQIFSKNANQWRGREVPRGGDPRVPREGQGGRAASGRLARQLPDQSGDHAPAAAGAIARGDGRRARSRRSARPARRRAASGLLHGGQRSHRPRSHRRRRCSSCSPRGAAARR